MTSRFLWPEPLPPIKEGGGHKEQQSGDPPGVRCPERARRRRKAAWQTQSQDFGSLTKRRLQETAPRTAVPPQQEGRTQGKVWPQGRSLPHPVSCPLWWAGQLLPEADHPPAERGQPGKVSIPCRGQALLPSHPHADSCPTAPSFINPSRPCPNPRASHRPLLAPPTPHLFLQSPPPHQGHTPMGCSLHSRLSLRSLKCAKRLTSGPLHLLPLLPETPPKDLQICPPSFKVYSKDTFLAKPLRLQAMTTPHTTPPAASLLAFFGGFSS